MSEDRIESFLGRWSRLKRAEKSDEVTRAADEPSEWGADTALDGDPRAAAADRVSGEAGEAATEQPAKDYSDFDFEKLGYESDYEQFMKAGVPDDVRNTALRKLWASNPILTHMDGLDDYCEDYTDAAMCLPKGTMKTAYKFGRGFLSDAEVAEWQALGKPADAAVGETEIAAAELGQSSAATGSTEDATAAAAVSGNEAGETAAGSDPNDSEESAATTGGGCAAALKAQERAAALEDDPKEDSSDDGSPPAGPSKS